MSKLLNLKAGGVLDYVEERVLRSQFTDGGSTAGTYTMKVSKIMEDGSVVVDRNHPLAGKHLLYKVRVASVA